MLIENGRKQRLTQHLPHTGWDRLAQESNAGRWGQAKRLTANS